MSRVEQKSDGKGSLKDIQILINEYPDLLNALLRSKIAELHSSKITWLSPVNNDNFAEYRDDEFIELLKLVLSIQLNSFWPKQGLQWDALGNADNGMVFLIEAKANIPEIVSPATQASTKSKMLIDKSLAETKTFLNITNDVDWSGKFYQYTNRLAHLYFLRELNKKQAWLVNIYFVNDKEVKGPESKKEWLAALQVMKCYLGIGHHSLSKYMIDLFIDVEDFRE